MAIPMGMQGVKDPYSPRNWTKRANVPSAASFYTPSLPLLDGTQYVGLASGYLPARPPNGLHAEPMDDAHLFFVLERARHLGKKRRLIIWLNGGPGCSSFDGLMMEIGAFRPNMRGGLQWTVPGGAWNEYADVLYLDQPVGTGFSYVSTSGYARSLEQAAEEVVYFLQRFVEVYPEYKAGNGADVFLAGESFAGQYIPFTASALLRKGKQKPVDLGGISIGNGFIDPKAQSGTELEMMVQSHIWEESSEEYIEIKKLVDSCHAALAKDTANLRKIDVCDSILTQIIQKTKTRKSGQNMCINIYDVRLSDTAPACGMNWPPTLDSTYEYLRRKDVREALHVDSIHKPEGWVECNSRVGSGIDTDINGKASVTLLPEILEAGIPVLLFAGDKDLICNHIGVERIAERLKWGGLGWDSPMKKKWTVNNKDAGYWRTNRNLTYVSIADASHMVGVDKPIEAHDMMLRWMGVDLLAAAGPSAQIPSLVEGKTDRKVVIGGGGGATQKDDRPMIPGVDGKTEEQVAEEAKWAAYYNAGSAALVVLLILVGAGAWTLLRLRRKARLQRSYGQFMPPEEGSAHELDRFIPDEEGAPNTHNESYSDQSRLEATTALNTRVNGQRSSPTIPETEQIFDVGDESEDDLKTQQDGVRFVE